MRVVAGRFRGRSLATPEHDGLRPTSDRVRESVFNILAHGMSDFILADKRVIDLFAGTGALGIEALSRGAAYCLFVEESADARALIRRNVEAFGLAGETRIFRRDATALGPAGAKDRFDLAFVDPPYGQGLGEKALVALRDGRWLAADAIAVLEDRVGEALAIPRGFMKLDARSWGETEVTIVKYDPREVPSI